MHINNTRERSYSLHITNTGDVHSSTFRLYSTHQKQESTFDSSPRFKNGSVSAFANRKRILEKSISHILERQKRCKRPLGYKP